jgi:hypothetical protein
MAKKSRPVKKKAAKKAVRKVAKKSPAKKVFGRRHTSPLGSR